MAKTDYERLSAEQQRSADAKLKANDKHWTDPPAEFERWWNPTHFDPVKGHGVGGHADARRAIKRDGETIWLGVSAKTAWNCQRYRDEWRGQ